MSRDSHLLRDALRDSLRCDDSDRLVFRAADGTPYLATEVIALLDAPDEHPLVREYLTMIVGAAVRACAVRAEAGKPAIIHAIISPVMLRRMVVAGFVPGNENPIGWLVQRAEEHSERGDAWWEAVEARHAAEGARNDIIIAVCEALGIGREESPEGLATAIRKLVAERDSARWMLAECVTISGADTDGAGWEHLWPRAVDEVRRLRADSDADVQR